MLTISYKETNLWRFPLRGPSSSSLLGIPIQFFFLFLWRLWLLRNIFVSLFPIVSSYHYSAGRFLGQRNEWMNEWTSQWIYAWLGILPSFLRLFFSPPLFALRGGNTCVQIITTQHNLPFDGIDGGDKNNFLGLEKEMPVARSDECLSSRLNLPWRKALL